LRRVEDLDGNGSSSLVDRRKSVIRSFSTTVADEMMAVVQVADV
jgi:hypothetical protein